MGVFEVEANGKTFEIEAPDMNSAMSAFQQYKPQQQAEAPKPERQITSMPEAIGRGAAQGATFNFYDEMRGLVEASGANPKDPASLGKLLTGAYKYFTSPSEEKTLSSLVTGQTQKPEAVRRYDEAVARERGLTKQAEEDRPYSSLAGNVAGAVAMPLGAMAGAATLPARIGRGALVGAGTGALAGAGEGEWAIDRLTRAATGATLGAGIGAALPVGVEGITRGLRAGGEQVANAVRGVRNTDDEAARRVTTFLQRDADIDPSAANRLSPQDYLAAQAQGKPVNMMDMGGEAARALARSAANTSPEGRAALTQAIDDRFKGQGPRVTEWLNKNFNYPDAGALEEAVQVAARTANTPAYANAYAKGQALWDVELSQFSQAPVVQKAIQLAFMTGRNTDTLAGFPPLKNPFVMNKATNTLELQQGATPSLQFWDHVKRNLDKLGAEGQAFSKALRGHLDQLVPEYQTARAGAAAFFGADNALDAGRKFVQSTMDNRDAARAMSKLNPAEKKLFQDGFVSEYTKMLSQVNDSRDILNKIAANPAAAQRIEMVLGPAKAREMEVMLRVEKIMDMARPAVKGNSRTVQFLAELGLASGAYGFSASSLIDPTALAGAVLTYGAARGRNKLNENLSKRVAQMLASGDPQTLLRGAQVIANNKQLFNSLRSADQGLARVGGEQSSGVPALQSMGVGRAEDDPNVQRPRGQ